MRAERLLLENTERGLYCAIGDFYVDAWKSVERNVVTHGHGDHARRVAERYLTARDGVGILKRRLGEDLAVRGLDYGEVVEMGGVKVSLHPAGHILGSSQVRLEYKGEVWLFTGDYKRAGDATCRGFELVGCDTLVTECTFGLPLFHWPQAERVAGEINGWWRENAEAGRTSVLLAYSLGKAQRVLSILEESIGPILLHGAVLGMTEVYREGGVKLPAAEYASGENARLYKGRAMVVAPPSALNTTWIRKFGAVGLGVASGWMAVRGFRRRKAADRGFVLSDHVDWEGLLATIKETGCGRVIATHGYTGPVVKSLRERGMEAAAFETRFKNEGEEEMGEEQEAGGQTPEEAAKKLETRNLKPELAEGSGDDNDKATGDLGEREGEA